MTSPKLVSGLVLGLTLLASSAFAQGNAQQLNTDGIARAIGKPGDNHLLDNEPQLMFMHFWAHGDAIDLTKGLRAALDRIGS